MIKTLFPFLRCRRRSFSFAGVILNTVVGPRRQGFRAQNALNRLSGKALTAQTNYQDLKFHPAKEKQENKYVSGQPTWKETTC